MDSSTIVHERTCLICREKKEKKGVDKVEKGWYDKQAVTETARQSVRPTKKVVDIMRNGW